MNIGLQCGIVDAKHAAAMEQAVWLYMWCVKCQTKRAGGSFVLGGKPLTYAEIAQRSTFPERRIRRWLDRLRKYGYVKVTYLNYMKLRIEVTKAKKWSPKQTQFPYEPLTAHGQPKATKPLTAHGHLARPSTVKGSTIDGQPKQKCSLRVIKAHSVCPDLESRQDHAAAEVFTGGGKPAAATATAPVPPATLEQIRVTFEAVGAEPFGKREFQNIFADVAQRGAPSWADAMERSIQCCSAAGVTVPGRFYRIKHVLEKLESEQVFRRTPT